MALLSLALYAGQKPYTQVYDIPLGMTGESFYLEILTRAEDIAYETNAENIDVHVFEDKERGENRIVIEGAGKAGEIKRLKLSGDTDDTKTGWTAEEAEGLVYFQAYLYGERNVEKAGYLFLTFYCLLFFASPVLGSLYYQKRGMGHLYRRVLEGLYQKEENRPWLENGKRCFDGYRRRAAADTVLFFVYIWLCFAKALREYRGGMEGSPLLKLLGTGLFFALGCVIYQKLEEKRQEDIGDRLLCREARPLSGGAFYLYAGAESGWRNAGARQFVRALTGLIRGGQYQACTELAEGRKRGGLWKEKPLAEYDIAVISEWARAALGDSQGEEEERRRQAFYWKRLSPKQRAEKETQLLIRESGLRRAYERGGAGEAGINRLLSEAGGEEQKLTAWYLLAEMREAQGRRGEAEALWKRVLGFSPENEAVRRAMRHGPCTWREEPPKRADGKALILAGVLLLGSMFLLLQFAAARPESFFCSLLF